MGRNETSPTPFRVEVVFLAGSGGNKGGTGLGNPGKFKEEMCPPSFLFRPPVLAKIGDGSHTLLRAEIASPRPGEQSGNEALEAGRK